MRAGATVKIAIAAIKLRLLAKSAALNAKGYSPME